MLLYNNQLLPEEDFALPLPNRGLFFNDGFFETMIWAENGLRYLPHHLARMQRAAAALGLVLPPAVANAARLTETLGQLLATTKTHHVTGTTYRVRLQLWRDGSGLYTPETTACNWLATFRPFAAHEEPPATAGFAETVRTRFSPVSFCKGPESLTYVLAAQERARRGLDELLLLDAAGHVAESVSAAVFWIRKDQLFTPHPTTGCVAGVRRAHLMEVAQQQGVPTNEVRVRPAALAKADIVFTANVAGIRVVQQLGVAALTSSHPLLTELRRWEVAL